MGSLPFSEILYPGFHVLNRKASQDSAVMIEVFESRIAYIILLLT